MLRNHGQVKQNESSIGGEKGDGGMESCCSMICALIFITAPHPCIFLLNV